MNRELYQEDAGQKKTHKTIDVNTSSLATRMDLDEMIQILVKAGYEIQKTSIRKISFGTGG